MSKEFSNDWCFSGEIVRLQPFNEETRKDYFGSVTVKGVSRDSKEYYPKVCEINILCRERAWNEVSSMKKCYDEVELTGHFEQTATRTNPIKLVMDMVVA